MIRNQQVAGSSPAVGSSETPATIEFRGPLAVWVPTHGLPRIVSKCCKPARNFCEVAGKWRALVLAFLAFPLSAQSREWTRTDTLLASAYVAAQIADWSQTSQIKDYPGLWESNPTLGPHPSQGQINRHFIKTTISDLAMAYILRKIAPAWVSRSFIIACTISEIECIRSNQRLGIRVKFGVTF